MSTRSRAALYARIRCTYTEWSFRTTLPGAPARLILAVHLATGQRLRARDETELEEKLMSAQRAMRNNWGNERTASVPGAFPGGSQTQGTRPPQERAGNRGTGAPGSTPGGPGTGGG